VRLHFVFFGLNKKMTVVKSSFAVYTNSAGSEVLRVSCGHYRHALDSQNCGLFRRQLKGRLFREA